MQSGSASGPIVHSAWGVFEWLIIIIPALILLVIFYVIRKGRRVEGEHVFRASRASRGNRIFPTQVVISPSSITLYQPQWIGRVEESIHMAHVASIRIDTHMVFADVFIETSSGKEPIVCHGHTKGDATAMKQLVENFQSDYYRAKSETR